MTKQKIQTKNLIQEHFVEKARVTKKTIFFGRREETNCEKSKSHQRTIIFGQREEAT